MARKYNYDYVTDDIKENLGTGLYTDNDKKYWLTINKTAYDRHRKMLTEKQEIIKVDFKKRKILSRKYVS